MSSLSAPFSALQEQEVFAVDERSAQLCVRAATDAVSVDINGRHLRVPTTNGVAIVNVDDLDANATYRAVLSDDNGVSLGDLTVQTLPSIGPVRSRFATISDLHLGAKKFGPSKSIGQSSEVAYSLECAKAALADVIAWGAEVLLVKGDLTDNGEHDDWALAQELFADCPIPFLFTPGNHDVWKSRDLEPPEGAALLGVTSEPIIHVDLDGIRLLLVDTARPNRGTGDLARSKDLVLDGVSCDDPVFVGIHHNIQRSPIPWFWPPGISPGNAMPVVDAIAAANPRTFISSGHTHRNRLHWLGPQRDVAYTEVSATSDYPGVWAAYEVSDSTIRQTVRRTSAPQALVWTEASRAAIGGVWPRWSQGRFTDRCVDQVLR